MPSPIALTPLSPQDQDQLQQLIHAATAENTRKTYQSAVNQFIRWGGRLPCDEATIIQYLLAQAQRLKPATLKAKLIALSQWHQTQAFPDPTKTPLVKKTLAGLVRLYARPKKKAKALSLSELQQLLDYHRSRPTSLKRSRDLALCLLAYFGAFRISELLALTTEDLHFAREGLTVSLARSKNDTTHQGHTRALPHGPPGLCPVTALKAWLADANLTQGPLFLSINRWGHLSEKALSRMHVNRLIKRWGQAAQLNDYPSLSTHSFRRGVTTAAARQHVAFALIKKQGGWKTDSVVHEYIDEGQVFVDNMVKALFENSGGSGSP